MIGSWSKNKNEIMQLLKERACLKRHYKEGKNIFLDCIKSLKTYYTFTVSF